MKLKGIDKFREKIPLLSGAKIIIIPIYFLCLLSVLINLVLFFYHFPVSINNSWWNVFPILGILIIDALGVTLVNQMWLWRDKLKAKYQQTSYQHIFLIGFTGVICIFFLAFFSFFPLNVIDSSYWSKPSNNLWIVNIFSNFEGHNSGIDIFREILSLIMLFIGIMTFIKAIITFGFDYMTVVYLYFPEESILQNYEIYSILRHPAYAGLIYVCIGGFIFNFNLFSLLYLLIYLSGWGIHILFVEEKELINRFGESYKKYRKLVPAIFVRPKNWRIFFQFLFKK